MSLFDFLIEDISFLSAVSAGRLESTLAGLKRQAERAKAEHEAERRVMRMVIEAWDRHYPTMSRAAEDDEFGPLLQARSILKLGSFSAPPSTLPEGA